MASSILGYSWPSSPGQYFIGSFNLRIEESDPGGIVPLLDVPTTSSHHNHNIPVPPPLPAVPSRTNYYKKLTECTCMPKETRDTWDKLFKEGYGADVNVITEDIAVIWAHSNVLSIASPVLKSMLQRSKVKNGIKYIKIPGLPYASVYAFIRFLYSSCYEEDEMKKRVLHMLVLSHSFSIPSLKRVCVHILEQGWLTTENIVDVLQLAKNCDAPRLCFICIRMIVKNFKHISKTDGWKVMKHVNPALEQELLELVVEADSRRRERLNKIEDRKLYLQLYEAMEALLHICQDGCRTIGPSDKVLKGSQVACIFPACKGIETLVRHFSTCKTRVPGGCVQCKRMWQLLELHSRMCNDPQFCKVPLCRHFKEKLEQQTKKDEARWKLLVSKVMAVKIAQGPFSTRSRLS